MPAKNTCGPTAHDFDKFDDATIYCRRCGEQRVMDVQALIAKLPPITYLPCPGPRWPQPVYPWTYPVIWSTGTTTVRTPIDTVTYDVRDTSSYTVVNTTGGQYA